MRMNWQWMYSSQFFTYFVKINDNYIDFTLRGNIDAGR